MLEREDYRLRPLEEMDLERILMWRNSDRIRAVMFTDHHISEDEHRAWFMRMQQLEDAVGLIFEVKGRSAGLVYFSRIDYHNGLCFWGFYLGEENLPKGTGTIMGFLALDYAFENLGIRKLIGETLAFNTASIKFHKRLGFVEEGRSVRQILKNGRYEDVISFVRFNEGWQKSKQELELFVSDKRET